MKIYLLIAKDFYFKNDFRSNTINFISFIGLFIGAAAIKYYLFLCLMVFKEFYKLKLKNLW